MKEVPQLKQDETKISKYGLGKIFFMNLAVLSLPILPICSESVS